MLQLIRTPAKPRTHLDVLKLLAIFLVLMNHTGTNGFSLYTVVTEKPMHLLLTAHAVFVKIAVPLFLMISGALLLGREERFLQILLRRILRFAAILIIVSLITYFLYGKGSGPFVLRDFLTKLYTGGISTHLWYLYCYIAFLCMLPFLRKIAKAMDFGDFLLLLAAWELTQLLSLFDFALFRGAASHSWDFQLFTSVNYVVYALCGYYLEHGLPREKYSPEGLMILLMAGLIAIALTCWLTDWRMAIDGSQESYLNSFIVFPTLAVYYLAKMLFDRHPAGPRAARTLSVLAGCTFGTYLFERVWRELARPVYTLCEAALGKFWASCVYVFCACLLGIAASFLWKLLTALPAQLIRRPGRRA